MLEDILFIPHVACGMHLYMIPFIKFFAVLGYSGIQRRSHQQHRSDLTFASDSYI